MSATAHTADPAHTPGPLHDRAAIYAARLLGFLHKLIDFGIQLAATAQLHPTGDALSRLGVRFGTKNIERIIARIARGLRRAAELEERLAGGRPTRQNPAQAAADSLCPPKPRAPRSESQPRDTRPAGLPSIDSIAGWLRDAPFETVLTQICRDLGLMQGDPLQKELDAILIERFGDVVQKLQGLAMSTPEASRENKTDRETATVSLPRPTAPRPDAPLRQPAPHMVSVAATATGPP